MFSLRKLFGLRVKLTTFREHLRDHHLLAQCSRCWKIFDSQNEFDSHREGQGPECPDLSSMFWKREGVDPEKWGMIDEAFRTPKLKKQGNITRKSDFEKWMDVWNILFPKEVYPSLPRPTHPCMCIIPLFTTLYSYFG
jgi:hypothetical protein